MKRRPNEDQEVQLNRVVAMRSGYGPREAPPFDLLSLLQQIGAVAGA